MTWKQLAFSEDVMTNPATADLDMADYTIENVNVLVPTDTLGINFFTSAMASSIVLSTADHALVAYDPVNMNSNKIESLSVGTADADAIRKDQALLLNGTQAMTAALNMSQNEIDEMVFENLATAPHSGTEVQGEVYYDTADDHLHIWVV